MHGRVSKGQTTWWVHNFLLLFLWLLFCIFIKKFTLLLLFLFYVCSIFISEIPCWNSRLIVIMICPQAMKKVSFVADFSCYLLLVTCLQITPFLTMVALFFLLGMWSKKSWTCLSASLPVDCHQVLADYPMIHIIVTRLLLVLYHCCLDFGFFLLETNKSFLCFWWDSFCSFYDCLVYIT